MEKEVHDVPILLKHYIDLRNDWHKDSILWSLITNNNIFVPFLRINKEIISFVLSSKLGSPWEKGSILRFRKQQPSEQRKAKWQGWLRPKLIASEASESRVRRVNQMKNLNESHLKAGKVRPV